MSEKLFSWWMVRKIYMCHFKRVEMPKNSTVKNLFIYFSDYEREPFFIGNKSREYKIQIPIQKFIDGDYTIESWWAQSDVKWKRK